MRYIYKQLQKAINTVENWAEEWGFKVSVSKSKYVVFGFKREKQEQGLKIYNIPIERVKSVKFLGVWFEERMTWRVYIDQIVDRCEKVINILRCLVGRDWGGDRNTLMMIYRGIIRSNIDYGCMAYGSAAPSVLKKLEVIQAKALRICSGAMRTTPINALLVEMEETTLEFRRTKLSLNYWSKLRSFNSKNPSRSLLEEHWEFQRRGGRDRKGSMINSVDKRAQDMGMKDYIIGPAVCWSPVPRWFLPEPTVDFSVLDQVKKDHGNPVAIVCEQLKENWSGSVHMMEKQQ